MLLKGVGKNISSKTVAISFLGGLFFNIFLPSTIGGDSTRVIDLSFHTKDSSFVLASVILDRLSGLLGLSLIALFSCIFGFVSGLVKNIIFLYITVIIFLILVLVLAILFSQKFFNKIINNLIKIKKVNDYLQRFFQSYNCLLFQKKFLFQSLILSLIIQGGVSLACYFIGLSLNIKLNIIYYLIFIPLVTLIATIPISFGGLGIRENAAVFFFSGLQIPTEKVVAMSLILFGITVLLGILGGIIYVIALCSRWLQHY